MEAMYTGWEPYRSQIPPFGRMMAPYRSRICRYGSHVHQTELPALWESDGTHEDHRRDVCTVWVVCAPYLMQMVPYGSHIHREGTIQEPCAPCWSHV
jgi:hypothetical protein